MSDNPSSAPDPVRRRAVHLKNHLTDHLTEDWAATVVGLLLVVLFLGGVLPAGLVPR